MAQYLPEHGVWLGFHYRGDYLCPQCQAPARLIAVHEGPVTRVKHYEVHCDARGAHVFLRDVPSYMRFLGAILKLYS